MIFEIFLSIILLYFVRVCEVSAQQTIAFSAIKGERNGPYITFHTMLANSSAKFNALYGVFVCSEPGLYYFSFQVLSQQNSDLRVSLRTNRVSVITAFSGSKSSFNMASGSAILELEVDDLVYCFVEDGQFYESPQENRSYTSFTGFKIGSTEQSGGGFFSSLMGRRAPAGPDHKKDVKSESQKGLFAEIDSNDNIYHLIHNSNKNSTLI